MDPVTRLEEVLLVLRGWERDPEESVRLPAALAGGAALGALYRVADTITSGQTDPESARPRVLARDGRYEHTVDGRRLGTSDLSATVGTEEPGTEALTSVRA